MFAKHTYYFPVNRVFNYKKINDIIFFAMKKGNELKVGILSQVFGGIVNIALCGVKFYIGTITNCISILQDAYNNLGDVVGNATGALGIGLAGKKPTEKYPHGFGRFEDVATLFMYIIYFLVGALFIYKSVERLFFHPPIFFLWWSFIVVAITMLVKVGMFFGYWAAYKVNKSSVIKADMIDSLQDVGITAMTLLSYGLSMASAAPVDAIIGIIIGVFIIVSIIKNLKGTIESLMGSWDIDQKVEDAFEANKIEYIDYKAFGYGRRIECVVELKNELTEEQIKALEDSKIFIISAKFDKKEETV